MYFNYYTNATKEAVKNGNKRRYPTKFNANSSSVRELQQQTGNLKALLGLIQLRFFSVTSTFLHVTAKFMQAG